MTSGCCHGNISVILFNVTLVWDSRGRVAAAAGGTGSFWCPNNLKARFCKRPKLWWLQVVSEEIIAFAVLQALLSHVLTAFPDYIV